MNERETHDVPQEPLPKSEAAQPSEAESLAAKEAAIHAREAELTKREAELSKLFREDSSVSEIAEIAQIAEGDYLTPEDQAKAIKRISKMSMAAYQRTTHRGPLPDPATFQAYELTHPGTAERILHRFEKQSDHRMDMEKISIQSNAFSQKAGVTWAGILGLLALVGGTFLSYEGKDLSGMTLYLGALGSFLGAFLYSKHTQAEERKDLRQRSADNKPAPPTSK